MTRRQKRFGARPEAAAERVAGGGLLHRRTLLKLDTLLLPFLALLFLFNSLDKSNVSFVYLPFKFG